MTVHLSASRQRIDATFTEPVGGSGHRTHHRSGIELCLRSEGHGVGFGEASPIAGYSAESLTEAEAELRRVRQFSVTFPESPGEVRDHIVASTQALELSVNSVKFAFETALLDLFSRHLKVSAAEALRAALPNGEMTPRLSPIPPANTLPLSTLIPVGDHKECLAQARRAYSRGYRAFKIKLGSVEEFSLVKPTLSELREKYGNDVSLRFDPNGAWPLAQLSDALGGLEALRPEFVEEPAPVSQLIQLGHSPVPLALDESLLRPTAIADVWPLRDALKLTAVVLKPALLGLMRAFEIALDARKLGLGVIVTHLFDGAVGHSAAVSLAQAIGSPHLAHGLAPHPGLLMSPQRRIVGLGQGQVRYEPKPGLPLLELSDCST